MVSKLPVGLLHAEAVDDREAGDAQTINHYHYQSPVHKCRYAYLGKTSNYDEEIQLQSWTERCKCGRYCLAFMKFSRAGNCLTPLSKKYWFNVNGELEKETGSLKLNAIIDSKKPITSTQNGIDTL